MRDVVTFAYRGEMPPSDAPGNNLPGRAEIFAKLQARELRPVISLHAEKAFTASGVEAHRLVAADELELIGAIALQEVGVLVNRFDRSIKKDRLPHQALMPHTINEN